MLQAKNPMRSRPCSGSRAALARRCAGRSALATRHGLKVGFTPVGSADASLRVVGLAFLPLVLRAGIGNLCGIGWGRGLVLMVLGGPVMSLISYTGFLFVPLGHGSVIQPSCATLGGLLLAAVLLQRADSAVARRSGRSSSSAALR